MLALATTSIAWVFFTIITVGFVVYYFMNRSAARPELGSEALLAPNRKPYYDDEELEGPRLERMQILAVLLLVVLAIGLPLYWVFEPDRQAGATDFRVHQFEGWGHDLFKTTAEGGYNCAGCHGGDKATGGVADYALTDPKTGEVTPVAWSAPALDTVFYRFSADEIKFIIVYGRPGSPMPAWGTDGGGPLSTQQIETLVAYLRSIQIPRIGCADNEKDPLTCPTGELPEDTKAEIEKAATTAAQKLVDAGKYATVDAAMGEALFNLNLASGAYSCARCHTRGWSYGNPGVPGQGAFGWNLTGGSTNDHFPAEADMIAAISGGSEFGKAFGVGQGTGRMPAFGNMLTQEQIKAIVEYVRSL